MLIVIVNIIALVAMIVMFVVAKSGISHYMDLYQNEQDAKKLNLIVNLSLIVGLICVLLSCTLIFYGSGYNTNILENTHGYR